MKISKVLSYLGGYFNNTKFELDIPKIADVSESSEEEVENELHKLSLNGDISISNNQITLISIVPKTNKKFNDLYSPIETVAWDKNTILKLDK